MILDIVMITIDSHVVLFGFGSRLKRLITTQTQGTTRKLNGVFFAGSFLLLFGM